jgi:hypothetical protein
MLGSLYKTCTLLQDQCSPISDSTLSLSFLLWSNSETLQSHIQTKSTTWWFQSRTYWFQPRTCLPTRCRRRGEKIEKSDTGNTEMTAARDARDEVWSRRRQVSQNGRANQNSPAHHEGWMISSHETVFCSVPVSHSYLSCIFYHLPTKNPTFGLLVGR